MVLSSSWLPKSCLSLKFSASAYAIAPRRPGGKKKKSKPCAPSHPKKLAKSEHDLILPCIVFFIDFLQNQMFKF
jgi:hypothetical protein